MDVSDLSTCLGNKDIARGMVPDFLDIGFASGKTQVDVSITSRDGAVFSLTVHANRLTGNAQQLSNFDCIRVR